MRIAPIAHYKRATVSDSLLSLFTKERKKRFALFQKRIAISLFPSQFARKTEERIPNPAFGSDVAIWTYLMGHI